MSGFGNTLNVRYGLFLSGPLSGLSHFWFEFFAVAGIAGQAPRAVEDCQLPVRIFVDAYGCFDVVATVAVGRDLQEVVVVDDAVIGAYGTRFLQA